MAARRRKVWGLLHSLRPEPVFGNHRQLSVVCHAHAADIGIVNELYESGGNAPSPQPSPAERRRRYPRAGSISTLTPQPQALV